MVGTNGRVGYRRTRGACGKAGRREGLQGEHAGRAGGGGEKGDEEKQDGAWAARGAGGRCKGNPYFICTIACQLYSMDLPL